MKTVRTVANESETSRTENVFEHAPQTRTVEEARDAAYATENAECLASELVYLFIYVSKSSIIKINIYSNNNSYFVHQDR